MSGFIYLWRDRKHKRFYIGSHWGSPDDGYICSSSWMKSSYKKRPNDFKRRIIATVSTNRKDLLIEEQRWLFMIKREEISPNTTTPRYYNLHNGKVGHWTAEDSAMSIRQKISARTKEAMQRPEVRAKYDSAMEKCDRQKYRTPEYKEQIRQTCLTKKLNQGKLTVRYPNETKCFHVCPDDPRWLNGELVTPTGKYHSPKSIRPYEGKPTGKHHHTFKGYYHTPWGRFETTKEASEKCPYGKIHADMVRVWCKDLCDVTVDIQGRPPKILQPEWMGKTRRDIGFWFETT